jgi:hypothetical protein
MHSLEDLVVCTLSASDGVLAKSYKPITLCPDPFISGHLILVLILRDLLHLIVLDVLHSFLIQVDKVFGLFYVDMF